MIVKISIWIWKENIIDSGIPHLLMKTSSKWLKSSGGLCIGTSIVHYTQLCLNKNSRQNLNIDLKRK